MARTFPALLPRQPRGVSGAGSSSATHSTWWVIGKPYMTLSVSAILCGRVRSGGRTGP